MPKGRCTSTRYDMGVLFTIFEPQILKPDLREVIFQRAMNFELQG